jgi:hypothetical protein
MKLSAYYKYQGNYVVLKQNYSNLELYDKVFISKVFSDTKVPQNVLSVSNVEYGGTRFFYDKALHLPLQIENIKPDYSLYDQWVEKEIRDLVKKKKVKLGEIYLKKKRKK